MTNMRQSNGLASGNVQFTSDGMILAGPFVEEPLYVENVWA